MLVKAGSYWQDFTVFFPFRLFYEPLNFCHLSMLVRGKVLICPIEADRKLGNSFSIKRASAIHHQSKKWSACLRSTSATSTTTSLATTFLWFYRKEAPYISTKTGNICQWLKCLINDVRSWGHGLWGGASLTAKQIASCKRWLCRNHTGSFL